MTSLLNSELLSRFIVCFLSIFILARIYYYYHRHREFGASFILFGCGVFFVTALLHGIDISMGFAFGLFAIFSMLRYRTESIGIQEMTYLFLIISIALLTAVSPASLPQLAIILFLIMFITYLMETGLLMKKFQEQMIEYERIENIHPQNRERLIEDLTDRTGLQIIDVDIVSISFLRDSAMLRIRCCSQPVK